MLFGLWTRGAARCDILPQVGGSIGAWSVNGQEMLRTASKPDIAARDPYATAGFPLVPYSNRPPSRETASDMSDSLVATPRWANSAVRLG